MLNRNRVIGAILIVAAFFMLTIGWLRYDFNVSDYRSCVRANRANIGLDHVLGDQLHRAWVDLKAKRSTDSPLLASTTVNFHKLQVALDAYSPYFSVESCRSKPTVWNAVV